MDFLYFFTSGSTYDISPCGVIILCNWYGPMSNLFGKSCCVYLCGVLCFERDLLSKLWLFIAFILNVPIFTTFCLHPYTSCSDIVSVNAIFFDINAFIYHHYSLLHRVLFVYLKLIILLCLMRYFATPTVVLFYPYVS